MGEYEQTEIEGLEDAGEALGTTGLGYRGGPNSEPIYFLINAGNHDRAKELWGLTECGSLVPDNGEGALKLLGECGYVATEFYRDSSVEPVRASIPLDRGDVRNEIPEGALVKMLGDELRLIRNKNKIKAAYMIKERAGTRLEEKRPEEDDSDTGSGSPAYDDLGPHWKLKR